MEKKQLLEIKNIITKIKNSKQIEKIISRKQIKQNKESNRTENRKKEQKKYEKNNEAWIINMRSRHFRWKKWDQKWEEII